MKQIILSILTVLFFLTTSCVENEKKETKKMTTNVNLSEKKEIQVQLEAKNKSGAFGKLIFNETNGMVMLKAKFMNLSPGMHAIHLHEKADCSSPDGKSSGGHWNPTFSKHGKWGDENGYHKGDIGNFEVDENGNGLITMETKEWCIDCEDESKNIIGKAVIVHQGTDDLTSQPSGAAGSRIICGAILQ